MILSYTRSGPGTCTCTETRTCARSGTRAAPSTNTGIGVGWCTSTRTIIFYAPNTGPGDERRRDFFDICVPLYKASMEGDWQSTDTILGVEESDRCKRIRCSITENCETMLHVAVSSEHHIFVQKLVDIMQREDWWLQNRIGNTALGLAAITGNTNIARILVDKNRYLLTIRNKQKTIPLYIAVLYGKRDMVNYLYNETNRHEWTDQNKKWVYVKCVEADLFGKYFMIYLVSLLVGY
nr:ankyrin repeat-containing protein [Tanacetum cinerariifolium]